MPNQLRRLRRTETLRELFREVSVSPVNFICPIFVREGIEEPEPIESMPGIFRHPVANLSNEIRSLKSVGVKSVLLFGLPDHKDEIGSSSYQADGVVQRAIETIKNADPEVVVMTDVCVCAYTTHGHCGILSAGFVSNSETLPVLTEMAVSHAKAGADVVAPSSMMDEQVGTIRLGLREAGLESTAIMGYSSKFASAFYGPFREAADSAPSKGDRSSYQHDYANARHARRELVQDEIEGADILMVKPGLAYLDIVRLARETTDLPVAVYSVSGEYSMIKAAAERGWLDERKIVIEAMTAFRRAGADLIITYYAKEASEWLNEY